MFRGKQKSKMVPDQFGIGSLVIGSPNERWLAVGYDCRDTDICLLNLTTMTCTYSITVEDRNFLSEDETRRLVDGIGLNYTFSDFTLDACGMKPK